MKLSLSDKALKRIAKVNNTFPPLNRDKSNFNKLMELENNFSNTKVYWRFQPAGLELDHKSVPYHYDDEAYPNDEMEGVWAFVGLDNALRNMYDHSESYIEDNGTELVAIAADNTEDGPESYVMVYGGEIVGRWDALGLKGNRYVIKYLLDNGVIREEDL